MFSILGWLPWVGLTTALAWWCPRLAPRGRVTTGTALFVASIVWIAAYSVYIVALQGGGRSEVAASFWRQVVDRLGFWLWFDYSYFWAVAAVVLAVYFHQRQREDAERVAALRRRAADAELRFRVAQLRPHFLFNALNGIAGLARSGAASEAAVAVDEVGVLLRAALELEEVRRVPLERELELLRVYLRVQRRRFESDLGLRVHADAAALAGTLPPLILQPLVENAVEHGVAPRRVEVVATTDSEHLVVTVRNHGSLATRSDGTGLRNVRRRLEALYGPAASLAVEAAGDDVLATIRIPADGCGSVSA